MSEVEIRPSLICHRHGAGGVKTDIQIINQRCQKSAISLLPSGEPSTFRLPRTTGQFECRVSSDKCRNVGNIAVILGVIIVIARQTLTTGVRKGETPRAFPCRRRRVWRRIIKRGPPPGAPAFHVYRVYANMLASICQLWTDNGVEVDA